MISEKTVYAAQKFTEAVLFNYASLVFIISVFDQQPDKASTIGMHRSSGISSVHLENPYQWRRTSQLGLSRKSYHLGLVVLEIPLGSM